MLSHAFWKSHFGGDPEVVGRTTTAPGRWRCSALFGIVLVAAGFVSVFLRMVRDSRGELAIRIALGATSRRLTARVTAQAMMLLAVGVALGLSAATVVAARLGGRLVGVTPTDPTSYAFAAAVAVSVGLGAAAVAARAAVGTAPSETLRAEG